jgi:hypothetical protein
MANKGQEQFTSPLFCLILNPTDRNDVREHQDFLDDLQRGRDRAGSALTIELFLYYGR